MHKCEFDLWTVSGENTENRNHPIRFDLTFDSLPTPQELADVFRQMAEDLRKVAAKIENESVEREVRARAVSYSSLAVAVENCDYPEEDLKKLRCGKVDLFRKTISLDDTLQTWKVGYMWITNSGVWKRV